MKKDFLFVNLQTLMDAKAIDGMAAGKFTDMRGLSFEIKPEDLPVIVMNTRMALQSTRDSNGDVIGFPIDGVNHKHEEAAGWITDVQLEGGVVQIVPRWNDLGRQLVGSDQMRYFSPTYDIEAKVLLGGSLTNWPASRTAEHQFLLRPVEMSVQLEAMPELSLIDRIEMIISNAMSGLAARLPGAKPEPEMDTESTTMEASMFDIKDLTEDQRNAVLAQAMASGNPPAELQARIDAKAAELAQVQFAASQHKAHIAEFCASLTGGTKEHPLGLPIQNDELVEFLASLSPEQEAKAEGILSRIHEAGMISFTERGSSRIATGTKPLPPEIAAQLKDWLSHQLSIDEFFKANAVELGAMEDYNLAEYQKEK